MTSLVAHTLQEVVFAALTSDITLSQRVHGIYDQPITDAAFPYVAMGETSIAPGLVKDRVGARITFEIIVWSNEPSQMEAKELMAIVDNVFVGGELETLAFDLLQIRLQNASVVRQFNEEGSLYRGRMSYTAQVYERVSV
ncbi:DUF3168 domain-containing protein [Kordiimonas aquimaris]|uniref:DUF3168 domain-containing protein n=1 Tax=Kordiimonas aquimaris TaxID=707591 RepID=UPI0021CF5E7D|nr:DUF3168 domain-containing protein [Kordiimonas aquimaris]